MSKDLYIFKEIYFRNYYIFQLLLGEYEEPKNKKLKGSVYMVPELTYILASCEERLAFVNMGLERRYNGCTKGCNIPYIVALSF